MPNEYNSLGQILSSGGEVALAKAIAAGWSADRINNLINHRLNANPDREADVLRQFGESMVSAADSINQLGDDSAIPIDQIPTNPFGFGPEGEGGRYRYSAEFSVDGGANWFQVSIIIGDTNQISDILDAIRNQGLENIHGSPNAFGVGGDVELSDISARVTGIERAF